MNKENNAARRLDSPNHYEPGDEIMCSMPEETGDVEPNTYDDQDENSRFLRNYSTIVGSLAAAYVATVLIYLLMARMWDEDEMRLHILAALTRIFQALARTFGLWALQTENAYNEYVSILH